MLKKINVSSFFSANEKVIIGFVILGLLFDFINKIDIFYGLNLIKYGRYLKLVFIVYCLIFIISHFQFIAKKINFTLVSFLLVSIIFLLKFNLSQHYVDEFLRYAFAILILPLLCHVFLKKEYSFFYNFYSIIKYFVILNGIAIVIGIVFNIIVFQTYQGNRFGFNGLILSQGLTPYVYLCAILIFWVTKNREMLVLTLILSLFSGVKAVYLFEFVLLSLLILNSAEIRKMSKILLISLVFISAFSMGLIILSQELFKEIVLRDGWLSALSSHRIDYTLELLNNINKSNFNVFIGALSLTKVRLELQMLDILLFLGVFGVIIYIYIIKSFYVKMINSDNSKIFFVTTICLSLFIGNLTYIPMASILFYLTLFTSEIYALWQQAEKNSAIIKTTEIDNFVSLIKRQKNEFRNKKIINKLEKLLHKRKTKLIEKNFKPMTMEQYNAKIDQAMEDSKNKIRNLLIKTRRK